MSQSVNITVTGRGASVLAQIALREAARQSSAGGKDANSGTRSAVDRVELARTSGTVTERGSALQTASAALTDVAGLLGDVSGLVHGRSKSGSGNQGQIDAALAGVDRVAQAAVYDGKALLQGGFVVVGKDAPTLLPDIRTTALGSSTVEGTTFTLRDLKGGGSLATGSNSVSSKVVATAIAQVQAVRKELLHGAGSEASSSVGASSAPVIATPADADHAAQAIRRALLESPSTCGTTQDRAHVLALLSTK